MTAIGVFIGLVWLTCAPTLTAGQPSLPSGDSLRSALQLWVSTHTSVGLTVGLIANGSAMIESVGGRGAVGTGAPDDATSFEIGSVTEVFTAPDSLVLGFVHAWNAHDVKALGELFAADADWVTAAGLRVTGREAIQAALATEHATWARVSTMRATSTEVRTLREELAMVSFGWEITLSGSSADPFRGNTLFLAVKEGDRWMIVSGQVALTPTRR